MKLSELAGYKTLEKPIITIRHEDWLRQELPFSQEAMDFMNAQMNVPDRERRNGFSASSLGSCMRQQQFTYLGMPQIPPSTQGLGIFGNGDFMHMRWQMQGISAGWLAEAEIAIPENEWGIKGTMDGVSDTNDVVEFKSINDRGFRYVQDGVAKDDHVFQVGAYMLTTGRDRAVVLYENKNTQEFKEIQVKLTLDLAKQVKERMELLTYRQDNEILSPMLEPCIDSKGFQYNYCPYRKNCSSMMTMADAKKASIQLVKDAE